MCRVLQNARVQVKNKLRTRVFIHCTVSQLFQDLVEFESSVAGREGRDDDVCFRVHLSEMFVVLVRHFDDFFIDESDIIDRDPVVLQ